MLHTPTDMLKMGLVLAVAAALMAATPVPPPQDDPVYMTQTGETQLAPPPVAEEPAPAPIPKPLPPKKAAKLKPAPSAPLPTIPPLPQLGTETNPLVTKMLPAEQPAEIPVEKEVHEKPHRLPMLLTLLTCLLVGVGVLQCILMRRQTAILDRFFETAVVSERAFLSVDNFTVSVPNLGIGQTISYQLWNSGKIPAQTLKILSKYSIGLSIPLTPNYDNAIACSSVIVRPGACVTQPVMFQEPVNEEQLNHLKSRRMSIFVWGKIVYADSFGLEQITGFCTKLVWQDAGYFAPEVEGGAAYNYFT